MAREARLEFGVLNVTAHPHPPGFYKEIFTRAAGRRVNFFGDQKAAISAPSQREDGYFIGRIFTWLEVDREGQLLDTLKLQEADERQVNSLNIPDNIGFNGKIFSYAFRVSDHTLIFQSKNELGKTLSPRNAERIFKRLFDEDFVSKVTFSVDAPVFIEVNIVPDDDSLEKILSIDRLQRLELYISRPNPDDALDDAEDIIGRLERLHARSEKTIITAAPGEGIQADAQLRAEAEAAIMNGYAKGEGRDGGQQVSRSTKEYPKIIRVPADETSSILVKTLNVAKNLVR